jgi:hypothetical protein
VSALSSVRDLRRERDVLRRQAGFRSICNLLERALLVLILVILHLGSSFGQKFPLCTTFWPDLSALSLRPIPRNIGDVWGGEPINILVSEHNGNSSSLPISLTGKASTVFEVTAISPAKDVHATNFHWGSALQQSFRFLILEHGFRIWKEPTTRKELAGPFFADYIESVKGLGGWGDGDEFYVNYIGHPMEGAVAGFIEVQNDPRGSKMQFGSKGYWKNRLRPMAFAAVYSTQFEIGPISEASIGNVGKDRRESLPNGGQGFVDLVITPTVGTGWLIGEDILDKYVIEKLERKTSNRFLQMMLRGLNPGRSFSNMLAGKVPWHRDTRGGVWRPSRQIAVSQ